MTCIGGRASTGLFRGHSYLLARRAIRKSLRSLKLCRVVQLLKSIRGITLSQKGAAF